MNKGEKENKQVTYIVHNMLILTESDSWYRDKKADYYNYIACESSTNMSSVFDTVVCTAGRASSVH